MASAKESSSDATDMLQVDEGDHSPGSSSSRTAREDAQSSMGGPQQSTGSRSDAAADPASGSADARRHGKLSGTVSSMLSSSSRPTSGHGTEGPSDQKANNLTMPRSINTVPVWARQEKHTPAPSPRRSPTMKPSTWPRNKPISGGAKIHPMEDAMTNLPPLHLAESTKANTAMATQQANQKRPSDDTDDRAETQTISTISTTDDENEADVGRFWSFTMPRMMGRQRPALERQEQPDEKDDGEKSKEASPHGLSALTSAVTGVLSGLTHEGPRSYESDAARQKNSSDGEKHMSGAHEGTRGGWSHDFATEEGGPLSRRSKEAAGDDGEKRFSKEQEGGEKRHRGIAMDSSFTRNQQLTPGWESPWRPESRGDHSIKFGKYRFNHHGEGSYFPRSDTGGGKSDSLRKRKRRRRNASGGANLMSDPGAMLEFDWWRRFLLHNAFVPLLFRAINIGFTTTTLAIAIKLYQTLKTEGAEDAVGSSPIVAIIFAPLTLAHVAIQIYVEYFSRPIGLWQVASKLFYTLIELIFICLWSAELSLSFDNYFTSTLACSSFASPYSGGEDNPVFGQQTLNNPSRKPFICRLQGALIGLVFTSLLAYIVVFAVSLFRIFVRVKR